MQLLDSGFRPHCSSTHPAEIMVPLDIIMMLPGGDGSYRNPCLGHQISQDRLVFFVGFFFFCKMPVPDVPSMRRRTEACAPNKIRKCADPNNSSFWSSSKIRHASESVPSRFLQHSCSHQPPETAHEVRAWFWQEISALFFFGGGGDGGVGFNSRVTD